jgi:hypothetical protein
MKWTGVTSATICHILSCDNTTVWYIGKSIFFVAEKKKLMGPAVMIECRELPKTCLVEKKPVFAVANVKPAISRGVFVVISGYSGSGKISP